MNDPKFPQKAATANPDGESGEANLTRAWGHPSGETPPAAAHRRESREYGQEGIRDLTTQFWPHRETFIGRAALRRIFALRKKARRYA